MLQLTRAGLNASPFCSQEKSSCPRFCKKYQVAVRWHGGIAFFIKSPARRNVDCFSVWSRATPKQTQPCRAIWINANLRTILSRTRIGKFSEKGSGAQGRRAGIVYPIDWIQVFQEARISGQRALQPFSCALMGADVRRRQVVLGG